MNTIKHATQKVRQPGLAAKHIVGKRDIFLEEREDPELHCQLVIAGTQRTHQECGGHLGSESLPHGCRGNDGARTG